MGAWWMAMFITFALVSVMVVNPIPVIAVAVAWLVGQVLERPHIETVEAAGRNPELPPTPTSGAGCMGFLVWCVAWGLVSLVLLGAVVGILEGGV